MREVERIEETLASLWYNSQLAIQQVDRDENGDVVGVWSKSEAGSAEELWRLQRFAGPDAMYGVTEPGWSLTRYREDEVAGGPSVPVAQWFLPVSHVMEPEEYVIQFAEIVGWGMARAMFRRFGLISDPDHELTLLRREAPRRPGLRLIEGGGVG